jgi:hypothetical protein
MIESSMQFIRATTLAIFALLCSTSVFGEGGYQIRTKLKKNAGLTVMKGSFPSAAGGRFVIRGRVLDPRRTPKLYISSKRVPVKPDGSFKVRGKLLRKKQRYLLTLETANGRKIKTAIVQVQALASLDSSAQMSSERTERPQARSRTSRRSRGSGKRKLGQVGLGLWSNFMTYRQSPTNLGGIPEILAQVNLTPVLDGKYWFSRDHVNAEVRLALDIPLAKVSATTVLSPASVVANQYYDLRGWFHYRLPTGKSHDLQIGGGWAMLGLLSGTIGYTSALGPGVSLVYEYLGQSMNFETGVRYHLTINSGDISPVANFLLAFHLGGNYHFGTELQHDLRFRLAGSLHQLSPSGFELLEARVGLELGYGLRFLSE